MARFAPVLSNKPLICIVDRFYQMHLDFLIHFISLTLESMSEVAIAS